MPKEPVERLTNLNSIRAAHLFLVAQKILKAIENSELKIEGANLFLSDGEVAGQEVPHVHLHIVSRFTGDGINISFGKNLIRASRNELNQIAEKVSSVL